MAEAFPKRFKRNNHLKRNRDAQEDAPEQKRAKDNHRPVKNLSTGVINLQYKTKTTSGNWHLFAKEWKKYAATTYGNLAQFMFTPNLIYYEPPTIPQPTDNELLPANDPYGWKMKNYEEACKRRLKIMDDFEQKKFPFFNDFIDHLSVESLQIVEAHEDFAAARLASDIIELWKIAAFTHLSGSNGGCKEERAVEALKAYYALEQGKSDLETYKQSTDARIACIRAIDPNLVPGDLHQSIHFFKNLDSGRYGNIQSTAKQLSLLGEETAYVKTLTEAYGVALNTEVINTKGRFVAAEGEFGICAAVSVQTSGGRGSGGDGRGGRNGGRNGGRSGGGRGGKKGEQGGGGRGKKSPDNPSKAEVAAAAAAAAGPAKKEMYVVRPVQQTGSLVQRLPRTDEGQEGHLGPHDHLRRSKGA